jgi:hypothetical protein
VLSSSRDRVNRPLHADGSAADPDPQPAAQAWRDECRRNGVDGWRLRIREDRLVVTHRHGLLWRRAEVFIDEAGGCWAKCSRCGDAIQIHHDHAVER